MKSCLCTKEVCTLIKEVEFSIVDGTVETGVRAFLAKAIVQVEKAI